MAYSPENLEQIAEAYEEWVTRQDILHDRVLMHQFENSHAEEFAWHGFARRLNQLLHCIQRTYATIPPNDMGNPNRDEMLDVAAFSQSFVMNIYGATDNLARIWYHERVEANQRLDRRAIGLRPRNAKFRSLLGPCLTECLSRSDEWFGYLEGYRDAFAHRIPLYVVPRQLTEAEGERFRELDRQAGTAVKNGDYAAYDRLTAERDALGTFGGHIMHSFGEGALPLRFHAQMICDLATIIEFGEAILSDLSSGD